MLKNKNQIAIHVSLTINLKMRPTMTGVTHRLVLVHNRYSAFEQLGFLGESH